MESLFYLKLDAYIELAPQYDVFLENYVDPKNPTDASNSPENQEAGQMMPLIGKPVLFKSLAEIHDLQDSDYGKTELSLLQALAYFTQSKRLNAQGQLIIFNCLGPALYTDLADYLDHSFKRILGISSFVIDHVEETKDHQIRLYWKLTHQAPLPPKDRQKIQDYLNAQGCDGWGEDLSAHAVLVEASRAKVFDNIINLIIEHDPDFVQDQTEFNPGFFDTILHEIYRPDSLLIALSVQDGKLN